jgi:hypothetical protein
MVDRFEPSRCLVPQWGMTAPRQWVPVGALTCAAVAARRRASRRFKHRPEARHFKIAPRAHMANAGRGTWIKQFRPVECTAPPATVLIELLATSSAQIPGAMAATLTGCRTADPVREFVGEARVACYSRSVHLPCRSREGVARSSSQKPVFRRVLPGWSWEVTTTSSFMAVSLVGGP